MAHVNDTPRDRCTCPPGWVGSHHWSCDGEVQETLLDAVPALLDRIQELEQREANYLTHGQGGADYQTSQLVAQLRAVEERNESLSNALHAVRQWCAAYPLGVFPAVSSGEMQFADAILREAGISMSAMHAGWARRAT